MERRPRLRATLLALVARKTDLLQFVVQHQPDANRRAQDFDVVSACPRLLAVKERLEVGALLRSATSYVLFFEAACAVTQDWASLGGPPASKLGAVPRRAYVVCATRTRQPPIRTTRQSTLASFMG